MKLSQCCILSCFAAASVNALPKVIGPGGDDVSPSSSAAPVTTKTASPTANSAPTPTLGSSGSDGTVNKGISEDLFDLLTFYSQWAAAAYCESNFQNGATTKPISCASDFCPSVQHDNATSFFEWEKPKTGGNIFSDVPGYIATDHVRKEIVIAFRGTIPVPDDILTDADFFLTPALSLCSNCKVHNGFYNAWLDHRADVIRELAYAYAANKGYKVVIVGHSLGGAVATIAAADLRINAKIDCDLFTYGSPRAGNKDFANLVTTSTQGLVYRVTHLDDPIVHVPFTLADFYHTEPEYWISDGTRTQTIYKPSDIDVCQPRSDGGENLSCANSEIGKLGLDGIVSVFTGALNWLSGGKLNLPVPIVQALDAHHHYFQNIDNCSPGAGYQ